MIHMEKRIFCRIMGTKRKKTIYSTCIQSMEEHEDKNNDNNNNNNNNNNNPGPFHPILPVTLSLLLSLQLQDFNCLTNTVL